MKKGSLILALLGAALVGRATASPTVKALAKKWYDKGCEKVNAWKETVLKEDEEEEDKDSTPDPKPEA